MELKRRYVALALAAFAAAFALLPPGGSARAEEPARYIALTFDDGPWPRTTAALLDGLRERDAHATFFLIGEQVKGMEDVVARMQAEGHQIGNHTYSHVRLDTASTAVGLQELARTETILSDLLGDADHWIRPPWGFAGDQLRAAVRVPLIHWSVDTEDWKRLDADAVLREILDHAEDGAVILLHDPYSTSVEAALRAIDILSVQGYRFVTLEELFAHMEIAPQPGAFYSRPDRLRRG